MSNYNKLMGFRRCAWETSKWQQQSDLLTGHWQVDDDTKKPHTYLYFFGAAAD